MPMAGRTTTAPVPPIIRRSEDHDSESNTPLLPARHDGDGSLCNEDTCSYYAGSCLYYFFCHAIDSVLLHICCCRCFSSHLRAPESLEPRNKPQKVFTFCIKLLSNLWASALLVLIARWVFLRPYAVKPVLGACTVNVFELQWQPAAAMAAGSSRPELRFNLTTHILFKNDHRYYSIGYNHLADAVYYAGEKLGPVDDGVPPFIQEPFESTAVDQVVVGRLRNASDTVVEKFARERVKGRLEMVVRFRVELAYKYWPFKAEYLTLYDCPLSSPVPHNGEPAQSSLVSCIAVKI